MSTQLLRTAPRNGDWFICCRGVFLSVHHFLYTHNDAPSLKRKCKNIEKYTSSYWMSWLDRIPLVSSLLWLLCSCTQDPCHSHLLYTASIPATQSRLVQNNSHINSYFWQRNSLERSFWPRFTYRECPTEQRTSIISPSASFPYSKQIVQVIHVELYTCSSVR